jgi:hypothetical protein
MSAPKIVTGARCLVGIADPTGGTSTVVGVFDNFSYGLQYTVQPAYVLGAFAPAELGFTDQQPVNCTASGWRVVGSGPFTTQGGKVPMLQDLLTSDYITLTVVDRQTGKTIATIHSVRCTGFSTAIQARHLESMTVNYMGILLDDETTEALGENTEAVGAGALP